MNNIKPSFIQIKRKQFIVYLFLCVLFGLLLGGGIVGASLYRHFFINDDDDGGRGRRSNATQRLFRFIDRNPKDSAISLEELNTFGGKIFRRLDDDDDDHLDLSEIPKRYPKYWNKELETIFKDNRKISKTQFFRHLQRLHRENDTDEDNYVSPDEIANTFRKRLFNGLDQNKDGSLSLEEFLNRKPLHYRR